MSEEPFEPLQIIYGKGDPWKVVIVSICANQVRGERARPVIDVLLQQYPTPEAMIKADADHVAMILHSLGFQHRRAKMIIRFSSEWLENPRWRHRVDRHRFSGVGWYAQEAWRIYCDENLRLPADDWIMEQWRVHRAKQLGRKILV